MFLKVYYYYKIRGRNFDLNEEIIEPQTIVIPYLTISSLNCRDSEELNLKL